VRVEIIEYQPNREGCWIGCSQSQAEQSELSFGASGMDLRQALPGQWFNGSQERTRAVFGVTTIDLLLKIRLTQVVASPAVPAAPWPSKYRTAPHPMVIYLVRGFFVLSS